MATVAETIVEQLGGNKFSVLTGARDFVATETGVQFRLPMGFAKDRIRYVRIDLEPPAPSDTYMARFYRVRPGLALELVELVANLHAEQLLPTFTSVTGLSTCL
jgi:hypothetical protein